MTRRIFEGSALGRILTSSKDKIQNPEVLKAKKLDCDDSFFKKMLSSTGIPIAYPCAVGREFQTCRNLHMSNWMADNLCKKSSTGLHTSQVFHLQMKITLTKYISCLSMKM